MTEMTEKEDQSARIRKGLSARRDPVSYQLEQDIVIPARTILRSMGDGRFSAPIGATGQFTLTVKPGAVVGGFKRVVAS